ncbi:hypothetical protein, partial [Cellulomonas triticagri]|uniref:hypothetical protein n=1 Tax=Cellulomonas triticagri TaxID=2483352 RepID=UPI0013156EF6
RARGRGRAAGAVALLVVGALLVPVAVVAVWARGLATDTDRYLATVAPLAEDPAVRSAVVGRVTDAVVDAVDVEGRVADVASAVAGLDLPPAAQSAVTALQGPLVDALTGFVRTTVERVVTSDAFAEVWVTANRTAHEQLVAVLRGDPDAVAALDADGTLSVPLGPVADVVRERLVDRGFTLADRIPAVDVSYPLVTSADLVRVQQGYRLLDVLGTWLPWLALGLLAAGVLVARRRARAVVVAGAVLVGGALLLGVGLAVGRSAYLGALPDAVQRPDAAAAVYDQVVTLLRVAVRTTLVLGLVVLVVGVLTGGTSAAAAVRAGGAGALGRAAALGRARGIGTGRPGAWVRAHRPLLRGVVAGVAVLVLAAADRLTPATVVGVAVGALVALLVVEAVAAAGVAGPAADDADATGEPGGTGPAG